MSNNDFAKNLVANRARRCSATILTWMENNIYEYLPREAQTQVRSTILSNVNDLSDIAIDIVKSDTGHINEFWVEELAELKDLIREI
jgi:hypothetical protein